MSHRLITKWNQWLNQNLGQVVLATEQKIVGTFLSERYGKFAALIGVPHQQNLLQTSDIPYCLLVTPLFHPLHENIHLIESNLYELSIASGSVDWVILPHTLELVDNPRKLLAEACRIVKPEGHLIICGFNPYSLWGLKKIGRRKNPALPSFNFLKRSTIKKWLILSDFELVKQSTMLYSPPIQNQRLLKKFHFMEWIGDHGHFPWGAVYVLMARAKVIPLTPMRLRWKQSLGSIRLPTTVPGPTARNSK